MDLTADGHRKGKAAEQTVRDERLPSARQQV
jgi:hypothetical protein